MYNFKAAKIVVGFDFARLSRSEKRFLFFKKDYENVSASVSEDAIKK
jgi:hypothetical protein